MSQDSQDLGAVVGFFVQEAQQLFSGHPAFGQTASDQYQAQGLVPHPESNQWLSIVESLVPAAAKTVSFFLNGNTVAPRGVLTTAALELLQQAMPQVDLSQLHVTLPNRPPINPPQPLSDVMSQVGVPDQVDLRPQCTPVADQGQTSRCSAFAWTHAMELAHNLEGIQAPRLSPTFSMLLFEKMQGEFKNYKGVYKGGEGTNSGPEPGRLLVKTGCCRQELWPDDAKEPTTTEDAMRADAEPWKMQADIQTVHIGDVKKVLAAGCPVHITMTTGEKFSDLGGDGVLSAAEKPHGDHGWHAMLVVGYTANHFIVKNSWGTDWGDKGYFYAPSNVLEAAEAEFTAMLIHHAVQRQAVARAAVPPVVHAAPVPVPVVHVAPIPVHAAPAPAHVAPVPQFHPIAPVHAAPMVTPVQVAPVLLTCGACKARVVPGKFCAQCGHVLEKFCPKCGTKQPALARFCQSCGGPFP